MFEWVDELLWILRDLSPRDRSMLWERYIDDMEYDDIARKHGIAVGSARNAVSKSLKRVRERRSGLS